MPSEFAQKVIDMLSPSLGKFMAIKLVNVACEKANLDIETIGKKNGKVFCNELEEACISFGEQIAKSIKEHAESLV